MLRLPTILALLFASSCHGWGTPPAAVSPPKADSSDSSDAKKSDSASALWTAMVAANRSHTEAVHRATHALDVLRQRVQQLDKVSGSNDLKQKMADAVQEQSGAQANRSTVLKAAKRAEAEVKSKLRGMKKDAKHSLREVIHSAKALKKAARKSHAKNADKIFDSNAEDYVKDMEDNAEDMADQGQDSAEEIWQDVQMRVENVFAERAAQKKAEAKKAEASKGSSSADKSTKKVMDLATVESTPIANLGMLCALAAVATLGLRAWRFRGTRSVIVEPPLLG